MSATPTAILYSANSGIPGDLNGVPGTTVESWVLNASTPPTAFGAPVKRVTNSGVTTISAIESGDDATDFYGILSRSAPTVDGGTTIVNSGTPNPGTVSGVVVGGPGYILVACTIGTPVRGGPVYMRVTAVGPAAVGDLEATSASPNNVLLPNVVWAVDGKDSSNTTAVRVNS
ncbi:MAG: hypothetical protein IPP74_14400 [Alphaproteobacteria bacterium]|nr:hypothetical protein [Alphaproteobacteria bacterium]